MAIPDLQNIGQYVRPEASQRAIETGLDIVGPYMGKPRKGAVNEPVGGLLEAAALTMASPLEEQAFAKLLNPAVQEVGRFVRPTQLISKHGAKWRWTSFLNDEVMAEVLSDGRPYSFLDTFGGTGIVAFMIAQGDWTDRLQRVVYNDLGDETGNLFRLLKTSPGRIRIAMTEILKNKGIIGDMNGAGFWKVYEMSKNHPDPAMRAAAYILRMKLSFGAKGENPSYRANHEQKAQRCLTVIDEWAQVFKDVVVWKKHFRDAIRDFNAQEKGGHRVVFLDPPYIGCQGGEDYEVQMPESEHRELAATIQKREATYIVTHLDNKEYRAIYGQADAEWGVEARYTLQKTENGATGKMGKREVTAVWWQKRR